MKNKKKLFYLLSVFMVLIFLFLFYYYLKLHPEFYQLESSQILPERMIQEIKEMKQIKPEEVNSAQKEIETDEKVKPVVRQKRKQEIFIWKLIIPKIGLEEEIKEGTTPEVLKKNIGHFEMTDKINGNIGLAGHNRGYPSQFFHQLPSLEKGDVILYFGENKMKKYRVERKVEIEDTDWSYLEEKEENKLTLITCIQNKPDKRLCVQAIEREER